MMLILLNFYLHLKSLFNIQKNKINNQIKLKTKIQIFKIQDILILNTEKFMIFKKMELKLLKKVFKI